MLSEKIENYRDRKWRREEELKIETVAEAERFIEEVGFCGGLTDVRTPLPSLYIAVCGRREAFVPRNVQKDYETSLAWTLKDDVLRRGRVFYAKLAKAKSMFVAPPLVPAFNCLFGVPKAEEKERLSLNARKILEVLRREWELASADLRAEAGISDRKIFNKALDELQARMKVVPCEVLYEPKFTYIWTLTEARFPKELKQKIEREAAVKEITRAFLNAAGETSSKEFARLIGITPLEANLGFLLLVRDGIVRQVEKGVFRLKEIELSSED
ncbi:MAG: winged helix DNA-binding domain-containing protein [Acidobacteriota bacterium]|nr:winged helix DNA-binding domain-containing protein [Acidobacteriota bacterium]